MGKFRDPVFCFAEREMHTGVDIAAKRPPAATFAVHFLEQPVDKCTVLAGSKKHNGFIPKSTAVIVIGFFK